MLSIDADNFPQAEAMRSGLLVDKKAAPSKTLRGVLAAILVLAGSIAGVSSSHAIGPDFSYLWHAPDATTLGDGRLARAPDGSLYGTLYKGGNTGAGAVYQLRPPSSPSGTGPWKFSIIYSFRTGTMQGGVKHPNTPKGGVIRDASGALYGVAAKGGFTNGVVYKLLPPTTAQPAWKLQIIKIFEDAVKPVNGLAFGDDGSLYGTTEKGGVLKHGMVYRLTPKESGAKWKYQTIFSFSKEGTGSRPRSTLLVSGSTIYGTTSQGGQNGSGTLFKLTQTDGHWTSSILHSFENFSGSSVLPSGALALDSQGALIGTVHVTSRTLGPTYVVAKMYRLEPPVGVKHTRDELAWIATFSSGPNDETPCIPRGVVVGPGDVVYGTAESTRAAEIYAVSPPSAGTPTWTKSTLWSFEPETSTYAGDAPVVVSNGTLYGASQTPLQSVWRRKKPDEIDPLGVTHHG